MKKQFYHHLIAIDTIHIALGDLDLSPSEKKELFELVEEHVHHTVLDTILSELEGDDKKMFLSYIFQDKHEDIWGLLKEKVKDSEQKIKNAIEFLKDELHEDIRQAHNAKK